MLWVGKITLACPTGRVVRKLTGNGPGDVISRSSKFQQAGCTVEKVEIVKRGVGSGLPDKLYGSKRARKAMWAPDPGADSHLITNAYRHVSSFGGARRGRKRKARR
jgi:hypothetical protein